MRSHRATVVAGAAGRRQIKAEKDARLFGGVVVLKGLGEVAPDQEWKRTLYQPVGAPTRVPLKAIRLLCMGQPPTRRDESLAADYLFAAHARRVGNPDPCDRFLR